jgi:hypothetical protein
MNTSTLLPTFLSISVILLYAALCTSLANVQQWDVFEISLTGPVDGNPFVDVTLTANFTLNNSSIKTIRGFYDSDGVYRIRFMPPLVGKWTYVTASNRAELSGKTGEFACEKAAGNNRGPVIVRNTYHFAYMDGTPFRQFGTTVYNHAFQSLNVQKQTHDTLKRSPFNKVRMLALPVNNDTIFPYEKTSEGKWHFQKFNTHFFQRLDSIIVTLRDQQIEADVILFNPYNNKIGFRDMTREDDTLFVRYIVSRLSAYRNVWWSMANEYDRLKNRQTSDWDRIGNLVKSEDPYDHLRSIHFSQTMYNPSNDWVTHNSAQNGHAVADFGRAVLYRDVCPKPVVYDEVFYEGDINSRWGQLSGQEMVLRFWMGTIAGTYVGHSETFGGTEGHSWLSNGGELKGESAPRIAFLKDVLNNASIDNIEPIDRFYENYFGGKSAEYYLVYFGREQHNEWLFELNKDGISDGMKFTVDVLDTWNMTVTSVGKVFTLKHYSMYAFRDEHNATVELPGRQYIALRIQRIV